MTLLEQIQKEHAAAFTHGGKFHADDVFSAALLLHFNPRLTISAEIVCRRILTGLF